jgi:hypothetical protein
MGYVREANGCRQGYQPADEWQIVHSLFLHPSLAHYNITIPLVERCTAALRLRLKTKTVTADTPLLVRGHAVHSHRTDS